jgi:hypothetical protein
MRVLQETTKPSGFDWIGNIPSSWTVDRIKDVIPAIYGGGTPDSSHPEYWEDGNVTWEGIGGHILNCKWKSCGKV